MYVVIENTPGYLPEDNDSATFENLDEAREYLRDEVERYCESVFGNEGDPHVSWARDLSRAHVTDPTRQYDRGRVFTVCLRFQDDDA